MVEDSALLWLVPVMEGVDTRLLDPGVEDGPVGVVELLNVPEDEGVGNPELGEDEMGVLVEAMLEEGTEVVTVVHDETVTVEVTVFEVQEAVTVNVTVGNS